MLSKFESDNEASRDRRRHETHCVLFPEILPFGQQQGSSDGGGILLKAADRQHGLIACLASCLQDERQPGKIDPSLEELLAQRVFAMACGYPDANDADPDSQAIAQL